MLHTETDQLTRRLARFAAELLGAEFACVVLPEHTAAPVEVVAGPAEPSSVQLDALVQVCRRMRAGEVCREEVLVAGEPVSLVAAAVDRQRDRIRVLLVASAGRRAWTAGDVERLRTLAEALRMDAALRAEREERRRLEGALTRSVELYRELVESASDLIYRADRQGRFTYVNPAAARATGYDEAELLGMHYSALVRPDYLERLKRQYGWQVKEGVETTYSEFPLAVRRGGEIWIGQNVQTLREGGRTVGIQGVARDITSQRSVELALRESEERFRNVVENLGEGVVITDLDDTILYTNTRLTSLTGFSAHELIGSVAHRILFPREEWERGQREMERRISGEPGRYEIQHVRKDGERRWFEINAVPYRSPDGEIVGTLALVQDIGDRRRAQEALRDSEARFRAIFEGAAYGIAVMEPDGAILEVNQSVERKFATGAAELRGRCFHDLVHPADREAHDRLWDAVLSSDQPSLVTEQRLRTENGAILWVRVGYSLVRDAEGAPQYVIVVGSDVTKQKERDEQLRESEERYRLIVEGSEQVFFYVHDLEHRFEYLSPSIEAVLGFRPDELLGRPYNVLLTGHPSDEQVDALTDTGMETGEGFCTYTVITQHKDGRRVPIEVVESPISRDGRVIGMQGFARDITERHVAREALERSEEYFRSLTENALDVIHVINADRTTRYVSRSVERLLGYTPDQLVGELAEILVHRDDLPLIVRAIQESRGAGAARALEFRALHRDGSYRVFEGVIRNLLDDPVVGGVVINSRDITERRRAEEEVTLLAALSRENPNPVLQCDVSGAPVHVNPSAERLTRSLGLESISDMLPRNHEQLVRAILEEGQEFRSVEVNVADRIFSWTYRPQSDTGAVFLFAVDITGRRMMEEQLRHDALHDALTGLPNRLLFLERLAHAILRAKRRKGYLFAVLFLDLDRFKVINDSLGHHVGDELLVVIARRLKGCLRPEDTVARLGGDEFAILLEELTDVSDATRVAERIHQELARSVNLSGFEVFTSASIGIALNSTAYERPEYLLRNADMAMYRAKSRGQARFEVFDREMHAQALTRLQIETDLRRALERDEFELYYQPVIDLGTGRLASLEALIRWNHPERGQLLPDEFIPVAEETGVILPMGAWVVRRTAEQLREWRERLPQRRDLSIGVNLSAKQLSQPDLVEQIRSAVVDSGLEDGAIRLEITESVVMENAESASVLLGKLKEVGVKLSLDDFGTGYSSLSHLHRFPLDELKIDRSFVGRMTDDERSRQLVHTILTLSRSLGVVAVAEGIETPEQLEILRSFNCRLAQGFIFSQPVTAAEVEEMVRSDRRW